MPAEGRLEPAPSIPVSSCHPSADRHAAWPAHALKCHSRRRTGPGAQSESTPLPIRLNGQPGRRPVGEPHVRKIVVYRYPSAPAVLWLPVVTGAWHRVTGRATIRVRPLLLQSLRLQQLRAADFLLSGLSRDLSCEELDEMPGALSCTVSWPAGRHRLSIAASRSSSPGFTRVRTLRPVTLTLYPVGLPTSRGEERWP
jgi:hypothetical protein